MDRMELRTTLNEARTEATITLSMNHDPLGHIVLVASELEGFIHQLADHRANMAEEVSPDLDPGAQLIAIIDPRWRTPWPPISEGRVLALRHSGLGWLSFVFPDAEAQSIGQWLQKDRPTPQDTENHT